jgi:hypothetical protein
MSSTYLTELLWLGVDKIKSTVRAVTEIPQAISFAYQLWNDGEKNEDIAEYTRRINR